MEQGKWRNGKQVQVKECRAWEWLMCIIYVSDCYRDSTEVIINIQHSNVNSFVHSFS